MKKAKTLVLGMGNTIRGDDGVGIMAAAILKGRIHYPGIEIRETQEAGINLLDIISGYEKVLIVDSICAKEAEPGSISRFSILGANGKNRIKGLYSSHQLGLDTVVKIAHALNLKMPQEVIIYAVGIKENDSFADGLTAKVKRAIPKLLTLLERELSLEKGG